MDLVLDLDPVVATALDFFLCRPSPVGSWCLGPVLGRWRGTGLSDVHKRRPRCSIVWGFRLWGWFHGFLGGLGFGVLWLIYHTSKSATRP